MSKHRSNSPPSAFSMLSSCCCVLSCSQSIRISMRLTVPSPCLVAMAHAADETPRIWVVRGSCGARCTDSSRTEVRCFPSTWRGGHSSAELKLAVLCTEVHMWMGRPAWSRSLSQSISFGSFCSSSVHTMRRNFTRHRTALRTLSPKRQCLACCLTGTEALHCPHSHWTSTTEKRKPHN